MVSTPAGPRSLASLIPRALEDAASLARELGAWVLVGPPPASEDHEWSFRTLSARTVKNAAGEVEAVLDDTYLVHPIKKMRAGPWANTILVGRSRTNDVTVAHGSVSKLHARIRVAEDGGFFISDAGSSNGTMVNGDTLAHDAEARLTHGCQVRFGGCSFQVFEPLKFAEILKRFSKGA